MVVPRIVRNERRCAANIHMTSPKEREPPFNCSYIMGHVDLDYEMKINL